MLRVILPSDAAAKGTERTFKGCDETPEAG
jgi:hypothetical protein